MCAITDIIMVSRYLPLCLTEQRNTDSIFLTIIMISYIGENHITYDYPDSKRFDNRADRYYPRLTKSCIHISQQRKNSDGATNTK